MTYLLRQVPQHLINGQEENQFIANIFWRPALSFCVFKHGDVILKFPDFWPSVTEIWNILQDGVEKDELQKTVILLSRWSILCHVHSVLKCLISNNLVDVNVILKNGLSLMHIACISRNEVALKLLKESGASAAVKDQYGRTPAAVCFDENLRKLVQQKGNHKQPPTEIVKMLKVESLLELLRKPCGLEEVLLHLQASGVDVNALYDSSGSSIAHVIVNQGVGGIPILYQLQQYHALQIDCLDFDDYFPLMRAALYGDEILVDYLLCVCGANIHACSKTRGTALHVAVLNGRPAVVRLLLRRGANCNLDDLSGCRADDIPLAGTDVDEAVEEAVAIIRSAREQRLQQLLRAVDEDELDKEELQTTDLFCVDGSGNTLLMSAAVLNHVHSMEVLLRMDGCPINAQHPKTGCTALAMACIQGNEEAVNVLLNNRACTSITNCEGNSALHQAIIHGRRSVVHLLLSRNQALKGLPRALELSRTDRIMHDQVSRAAHKRQTDIVCPVLFECALSGNAEKLYSVIEDGDDLDMQTPRGDWPAYLAAENGHLNSLELLHQFGSDLTRRHPDTGDSLLHRAAAQNQVMVTQFLLGRSKPMSLPAESSRFISVDDLNFSGQTPLQQAADKGHHTIVAILLEEGASPALLDEACELFRTPQFRDVQELLKTYQLTRRRRLQAALQEKKTALQIFSQIWVEPFDHNLRLSNGDTFLMHAAFTGDFKLLKFLLSSALVDLQPVRAAGSFCVMCSRKMRSQQKSCYKRGFHSSSSNAEESGRGSLQESISSVQSDTEELDKAASRVVNARSEVLSRRRSLTPGPSLIYYRSPSPLRRRESTQESSAPTSLSRTPSLRSVVLNPHRSSLPQAASFSNLITNFLQESSHINYMIQDRRISYVCAVQQDGRCALHRALEGGDRPTICQALIQCDSSCLSVQDHRGFSPLHIACFLGRKNCVKTLLNTGQCDLELRTYDGQLAEEVCNKRTIRRLIQQARINEASRRPSFAEEDLQSSTDTTSTFTYLRQEFTKLKSQQAL